MSTHKAPILMESAQACRLCTDVPLGRRPILQLSFMSKTLMAAQTPGRSTHQKGVRFDDASGDRLRNWLGIQRQAFCDPAKLALAPMGVGFPSTDKDDDLPPKRQCTATWRNPVPEELTRSELTLIIGRYGIDWHLPQFSTFVVTEAILQQVVWPKRMARPHPFPGNTLCPKRNPWFEKEVSPTLRNRAPT